MSNKLKKKRVGVVFGGKSSECEQSLNSGRNVYHNIDAQFERVAVYWDKALRFWIIPETLVIRNTTKEVEERLATQGERVPIEELSRHIDIAFLVTHGKYGDDGVLQGVLELQSIPYTGSGVLSAALGMNKKMQRIVLEHIKGVRQPRYTVFSEQAWHTDKQKVMQNLEATFGYPMVTKPIREGSTFGVVVVKSQEDFATAVEEGFRFDTELLVEPYIEGREFSCVVMGNDVPEALLPTETVHHGEIFTYDEKYLPGASQKITPMDVDAAVIKEIQKQCELTYKALRMKGYARIDGFYTKQGEVLITDPNSAASCGMASSSWTFHQATEAGFTSAGFITKAIAFAIAGYEQKKGLL